MLYPSVGGVPSVMAAVHPAGEPVTVGRSGRYPWPGIQETQNVPIVDVPVFVSVSVYCQMLPAKGENP